MTAWTRNAAVALLVSAIVASYAALAAAESLPAQHFPLVPVGGEPLKSGFAEVIHPNGPQIYAHHVYQLNGAESDRSYDVSISIWTESLTCSDEPTFVLPAVSLVTNASGNGRADVIFDPEQVAALGLRGIVIGGNVTVSREGTPAYATGCKVIELD
jgi:hypothetical protein